MTYFSRLVFFLLASCLLFGRPAATQDSAPILRLASGSFDESLSKSRQRDLRNPRDPMRSIVGLHLGEGRGMFHVDGVGVLLDPDAKANSFCVRLISEDTRYYAKNAYEKRADPGVRPVVETRSKYAAELLDEFRADAVITRIVAGAACNENDRGALVPAIPSGAGQSKSLTVYLNVPGDATARLMQKDKTLSQAKCEPVKSSIVVYNRICVLAVQTATPDALSLTMIEKGQRLEQNYPLFWAAGK